MEAHLESAMQSAVDEFSKAIEATRVPGELAGWLAGVIGGLVKAQAAATGEFVPAHERDFARIRSEEISLQPHIEQMRTVDAEILADISGLRQLADSIATILTNSQEQVEANGKVDRLFEGSVHLITKIKQQEQTVATWLAESFQRDIGGSG